jgi:hypothetical protein
MEEVIKILPFAAILISFAGILYTYFGVVLKLKEDIGNSNERLASLEVKTDLFWRCIENKAGDLLKTFPTDKEKDLLLDKLKERSLSLQEAEMLRTILDGEMGMDDSKDKFCYILLIARLEQIIHDLRKENAKIGNTAISHFK